MRLICEGVIDELFSMESLELAMDKISSLEIRREILEVRDDCGTNYAVIEGALKEESGNIACVGWVVRFCNPIRVLLKDADEINTDRREVYLCGAPEHVLKRALLSKDEVVSALSRSFIEGLEPEAYTSLANALDLENTR